MASSTTSDSANPAAASAPETASGAKDDPAEKKAPKPKAERSLSHGIQSLLSRFGFPPGDYPSRRILRDEEFCWTRYYKLLANVELEPVKEEMYDRAADNYGEAFSSRMKDYFEGRLDMFPGALENYQLINPPPLFDTIFKESIESRFKDDADIRSVTTDFKHVCVGNFFQKMLGKRTLQRVVSNAFVLQGGAIGLTVLRGGGLAQIAAGFVAVLASLAGPAGLEPMAALWGVAVIVSGLAMSVAGLRLNAAFQADASVNQIVANTQITLNAWKDVNMTMRIGMTAATLFLLLLPFVLPAVIASQLAAGNTMAFYAAAGVFAAIAAGAMVAQLKRTFVHWVERDIVPRIVIKNDELHQRYNAAVDNATGTFVNYVQQRLQQLQKVFSTLDKRIDQEEDLYKKDWAGRAKTWTKIKILTAKRVEYIEKDIQVEMWRIRMSHWSYNRLGNFLATSYVPFTAMRENLWYVSIAWWAIVIALWPVVASMSVYALVLLLLSPVFGAAAVAAHGGWSVLKYEAKLAQMVFGPIGRAIGITANAANTTADDISAPTGFVDRTITRNFCAAPLIAGLVLIAFGAAMNWWWMPEMFSPQAWLGALAAYAIPQVAGWGLFKFAALVTSKVKDEATRSNTTWNTEIGFLQQRISTDNWQLYASLKMHEVLGKQVERDKLKIVELKTRQKPEA